nr:DUF5050 domain-containing protein [Paenibacillus hamazuiensis]
MKSHLSKLALSAVLCALPLVPAVGPTKSAHAAASFVSVKLPDFPVTLNGNRVDSTDRLYPLIVYKDVTYVPMTWSDSRMMGLTADWSADQGLVIGQAAVTSSYASYAGQQKNASSLQASVAQGPIQVNGHPVDNTKEMYPILSFRDVTYFPLTWKFAHDEFGWSYQWDNRGGLSVSSNNPRVENVDLPADAVNGSDDIALFHQYYYFVQHTSSGSHIYRVSETDTSKSELVRSVTGTSFISFYVSNDTLRAKYHVGGATMGHFEDIRIEPPGPAEDSAEPPAHDTVQVSMTPPPSGGNLFLIRAGQPQSSPVRIGDPDLIYGWHLEFSPNGGKSGSGADTGTLVGNRVFVLASPSNGQNPNRIYSVDTETNETVKVVDTSVSYFKMIDNKLFYVKDSDHQLYSADIDGTNEAKLSATAPVSWFQGLQGSVFYTVTKSNGLKELHQLPPNDNDKLLSEEDFKDVVILQNKLVATLPEGSDYGIVVFDHSGKPELKVADHAEGVKVFSNRLILTSRTDHTVKRISGLFGSP